MTDERIRIIVLDRGFVMVCRCADPAGFGFWLPVHDARIIRRWGTSQGLAELVNGPLGDTVLDAMVSQETLPTRAILRVLEVDQESWASHLSNSSPVRTRRARSGG